MLTNEFVKLIKSYNVLSESLGPNGQYWSVWLLIKYISREANCELHLQCLIEIKPLL